MFYLQVERLPSNPYFFILKELDMKQIEKLTQEQERLMYQFRYDWINFVLQSNNSNNNDDNDNNLNFLQIYNKIKEDIWWRYEKAGLKNRKPIILIANSYLEEKLMIIFVNLSQTLLAQIGGTSKDSSLGANQGAN